MNHAIETKYQYNMGALCILNSVLYDMKSSLCNMDPLFNMDALR